MMGMEYAFMAAGLVLLAGSAYYLLRADPKEVDRHTDKFYKDLYEQDSRR